MIGRLAALLAAVLLVACGDGSGPSAELAEHAAPLVEAHELLEAHAEAVDADPDAAVADWPDVADQVRAAADSLPDPEGLDLEPRERSTLVGYTRGLEVAVGAWDDVHEALRAGDEEAAERAAAGARDRMRHLDRLRDSVTP